MSDVKKAGAWAAAKAEMLDAKKDKGVLGDLKAVHWVVPTDDWKGAQMAVAKAVPRAAVLALWLAGVMVV